MLNDAIRLILQLTEGAGTRPLETSVPGLFIIGGNVPTHQLTALYRPMIGFVIQGEKRMQVGEQSIAVRAPAFFLLPMHTPVTATVHSAPDGGPYRSVGLDLDHEILQSLLRDIGGNGSQTTPKKFAACPIDTDTADALLRLLRLSEETEAIPALAPAYKREIFFRVLKGPQGGLLRQLALSESSPSRIAKTVQWIRKNYDLPMDVGEVARNTGMAVTTFHRQFKGATGLSPIQFQKQLRLLEARNLIAYEGVSVSSAAFKVGYESPSQFTREYSRFFGDSPARHGAAIQKFEAARL